MMDVMKGLFASDRPTGATVRRRTPAVRQSSPIGAISGMIEEARGDLSSSIRGLFGQQTPEEAQAQELQEIKTAYTDAVLNVGDPNTPEGLREVARKLNNNPNPNIQMVGVRLNQQADILEEKRKAANRQVKKDFLTGISTDKYTPKSLQKATDTGNYSDLVFADKPLTGKDLTYHNLITKGTPPDRAFDLSNKFIVINVDPVSGQVTETNIRTGTTKVLPIGSVDVQEVSTSEIAQKPDYNKLFEEAGITMLQGVEKGTGILSGYQNFVNITVGQATDKLPYPGVGEMRQLLGMATQELASKLRENVRADTERREIEQMLDIKPSFLQSKENAIEKIEQIHAYLITKRNGLAKIADNVNIPRQPRVDAKSKVEAINSFLPKLGVEKRNTASMLKYEDLKKDVKKSFAEYAKKKGAKPEELWNKISPINRMYFF
jgi:hypothetical protein